MDQSEVFVDDEDGDDDDDVWDLSMGKWTDRDQLMRSIFMLLGNFERRDYLS